MSAQLFVKTNWHICVLIGLAIIALILLIAISPQWLASTSIAFLGTILGSLITFSTQWLISKKESTDRFRLASLDKRLKTHQEGFTLWRKLLATLNDQEKLWDWIMESQEWWDNSCLYLDSKSRRAFKNCISYASLWREEYNAKERKEIMEEISKTGDYLVEGVDLPAIGTPEREIPQKSEIESR
jgi:hypothetical protein